MRIIEKRWIDLYSGYQEAQFLEARLQTEWKRTIQVVHRRSGQVAESGRRRVQRITRTGSLVFLLLCVLLCAGAYYLPESRAQLLAYLCVLGTAASLAGATYMFYRGSLRVQTLLAPSMTLLESWWKSLQPKRYFVNTRGERAEVEFLKSLSFLDDRYIAVWGLLPSARITSDTDVLLLGPNGIWVFEVKYWSGTISKEGGEWFTEHWRRGRKKQGKSPDQQWVDQKEEIVKTIHMRLPAKPWLADLIAGGVVFTHEKAQLGQITGNLVTCGKPEAWRTRIRDARPGRDFLLEDQLQLLDVLIRYANQHEKQKLEILSARQEARQLYENATAALRKYVSERIR
ncbi:MAG TPA: nuclease-related domain-containing protein [Anaerolineales bacterium]|nr:nuclease-related domain-containing protein [Anaerolineales bacterium]